MYLLKKLFKLRDDGDSSSTTDKPFLEHLEDLRDVVFRVVVTLFVATILCYVFRSTMMDLLRRPIERVWIEAQEQKLPEYITPDLWEQAKKAADATSGFTLEQKQVFYAQFENEKLRDYAIVANYYRAVLLIEDLSKRQEFINTLPQATAETKDLLTELAVLKPSAVVNAKGDVVAMRSLKPTETFMLAIKLSLFAGVIISFPLLLYFILQFVIPGLKSNERKALWPAMIVGFGLFLIGVFFCYFVVLPKALDFFYTYSGGMGVENEWRIGDYITFTTQFTLIFGLAFELPVVVMTLVKIGLLSYQTMSNTRAYAVLTIFIVGAIITPTGDALTLSLLAIPMCLLYEMCIWLAYFNRKKELEREAIEEAEIKAYRERHGHDPKDDNDPDSPNNGGSGKHKSDSGVPVPVPVPGRISTQDGGQTGEVQDSSYAGYGFADDPDDYDPSDDEYHNSPEYRRDHGLLDDDEFGDDHFTDDHFDDAYLDEGDEFDDGEIEDFSEKIEEIKEKLTEVIGPLSDESEPSAEASSEAPSESQDDADPDDASDDEPESPKKPQNKP